MKKRSILSVTVKKNLKQKITLFILLCSIVFLVGACDGVPEDVSETEPTAAPAATPNPTQEATPTPSPTAAPTATPKPTETPTPVPTATPVPVYRDITEEDYETLFNESVSEEQITYLIQYLPVGTYENGVSAIAAKNVWESIYKTDDMTIQEAYEYKFINEGQFVTGDASKMFAWFGIVNNKGVHNDPADNSVTIDGDTLTIDLTQCEHRDWYYPRIVMGKVSDNDMYLYYAYSTDFDKAPDVHRTAVFVKDESGKYQMSEIVDREMWSASPAPPEYGFSIPTIQKTESGEDAEEYLKMFAAILEDKIEHPQEYYTGSFALAYIDEDDIPELIWVDSMAHFGTAEIYYYADHKIDMQSGSVNYGALSFLERRNIIKGMTLKTDDSVYAEDEEWSAFVYNDEEDHDSGGGNAFRLSEENVAEMLRDPESFILK